MGLFPSLSPSCVACLTRLPLEDGESPTLLLHVPGWGSWQQSSGCDKPQAPGTQGASCSLRSLPLTVLSSCSKVISGTECESYTVILRGMKFLQEADGSWEIEPFLTKYTRVLS